MSELIILLYRDWLEFKKKYISYIFLWFSFPMILYLFAVIPLNQNILKVNLMNYKNWASTGIWICSSGILSFIYSYTKLKYLFNKRDYLNKYLKAPLTNGQFLSALLISSVLFGIIQLVVSILITMGLNSDNWTFIQFVVIFFNVITILLFCSIIGLLSAMYIRDDLFSALAFFIILIFLFFSLGTLIPIEQSYNKFLMLVRNLPLYQVVLNVQLVYAGKSTAIFPLFLMNILNIILFLVLVIISYKNFRK